MDSLEKEIHEILSAEPKSGSFEENIEAFRSPLNQAVAVGEIGISAESSTEKESESNPTNPTTPADPTNPTVENSTIGEKTAFWKKKEKTEPEPDLKPDHNDVNIRNSYTEAEQNDTKDFEDDVPEQQFDSPEEETVEDVLGDGQGEKLSKKYYRLMADSYLDTANYLIGLGGKYLVSIPKHQAFYEFDFIVKIIDNTNERNTQKLKLTKEEKELLRPDLILILQEKQAESTPMGRLARNSVMIILGRIPVFMEIKKEVSMAVEQIREMLIHKKGYDPMESEVEQEPLKELEEEPGEAQGHSNLQAAVEVS